MAFVQWSHDGPVASLLGILTELNTPHTNWYILLNPETVPVIGLRYFQVGHKFDKKKKPVSVLRGFGTKIWKKRTLGRFQLQTD